MYLTYVSNLMDVFILVQVYRATILELQVYVNSGSQTLFSIILGTELNVVLQSFVLMLIIYCDNDRMKMLT